MYHSPLQERNDLQEAVAKNNAELKKHCYSHVVVPEAISVPVEVRDPYSVQEEVYVDPFRSDDGGDVVEAEEYGDEVAFLPEAACLKGPIKACRIYEFWEMCSW